MRFKDVEEKFKQLKSQYIGGQLSESEYKTRLEEMMFQDDQGRWWMIGFETGLWHYHNGTQWIRADPSQTPSTQPPSPEKLQVGQMAKKEEPASHPHEIKLNESGAQAKISPQVSPILPKSSIPLQQSSIKHWLPWGIGAVLLLTVIGGIWWIFHPTTTTTTVPTPTPNMVVPVLLPTVTTEIVPVLLPTPVLTLAKIKVGEVTDQGGVDDKSFNALGWKGVTDAISQLGVDGKYLESSQQSDYAKNIQQLLSENEDLIITVGYMLGIDTATAAKANTNQKFAIVDYTYPDCWPGAIEGKDCGSATDLPNVRGMAFQTDQAALLAGYLAAGMTKTGKVGSFGGIQIPTVTIFMKGFQAGVKYYNQIHGTKVEALGWEEATQKGLFTGNFNSTDDGKSFAASLVQQGADIILPVAGRVGLGSAAYCQATGKCLIIGVDTDWFVSANEYASVELSSVLKMVDVAVFKTIQDVVNGKFTGGTVTYTLADGGLDLAPFHIFDRQVPWTLKDEIAKAQADIIKHAITVDGILQDR